MTHILSSQRQKNKLIRFQNDRTNFYPKTRKGYDIMLTSNHPQRRGMELSAPRGTWTPTKQLLTSVEEAQTRWHRFLNVSSWSCLILFFRMYFIPWLSEEDASILSHRKKKEELELLDYSNRRISINRYKCGNVELSSWLELIRNI